MLTKVPKFPTVRRNSHDVDGSVRAVSPQAIGQAIKPYALSPVPNNHPAPKGTFLPAITGQRTVPGLGRLPTSATGPANTAILFRTWGLTKQEPTLKDEFYGHHFTY